MAVWGPAAYSKPHAHVMLGAAVGRPSDLPPPSAASLCAPPSAGKVERDVGAAAAAPARGRSSAPKRPRCAVPAAAHWPAALQLCGRLDRASGLGAAGAAGAHLCSPFCQSEQLLAACHPPCCSRAAKRRRSSAADTSGEEDADGAETGDAGDADYEEAAGLRAHQQQQQAAARRRPRHVPPPSRAQHTPAPGSALQLPLFAASAAAESLGEAACDSAVGPLRASPALHTPPVRRLLPTFSPQAGGAPACGPCLGRAEGAALDGAHQQGAGLQQRVAAKAPADLWLLSVPPLQTLAAPRSRN